MRLPSIIHPVLAATLIYLASGCSDDKESIGWNPPAGGGSSGQTAATAGQSGSSSGGATGSGATSGGGQTASGGNGNGSGQGGSAGASAAGGNPGGGAGGAVDGMAGAAGASGGIGAGGASGGGSGPTDCNGDSSEWQCTACAYPSAPRSAEECYCPVCPMIPLSKATCDANQAAFKDAGCSGKGGVVCPPVACAPVKVDCHEGQCRALE